MIQNVSISKKTKHRLTAFIDPILAKRAKVQGALEGLSLSEVVEKALEAYAPKLEKADNQSIHLKFTQNPAFDSLIPDTSIKPSKKVAKHSKNLVVHR